MANEIEAYTNFLFYNSEDGKTSIQVIADADAETIWTTQKGMAQIFGVEVPAISKISSTAANLTKKQLFPKWK